MPAPTNGFNEQIPPHNIEAEQSVLGSMLIDSQTIPLITAILQSGDFYADRHQYIYDAILTVINRREPVDLITIQAELRQQGHLDNLGGLTYLTSLINMVPTTANVQQHARIVEVKATARRVQDLARRVVDEGYTTEDPGALIAQAEAGLQQLHMGRGGLTPLRGFEGLKDWIAEYYNSPDDDLLPTGLDDLDDVLEIRRQTVHGLMGPSKMGKSTIARQMAMNQAEDGMHVLFVSLEENETAQRLNFLSLRSGVLRERIRKKWVNQDSLEWERVKTAAKRLDGLPIKFDYTPQQNMAQISAKIRYYALTWGVDIVYIDTGQAINEKVLRDERGDERYTRMVRTFEADAKVANCGVIMVIQGKTDIMTADSYWLTPMHISDARGMIQAFTSVIGVMRPEKITNPKSKIFYHGAKLFAMDKRWRNVAALFVVANRTGEENIITPVYYDPRTGQIGNLHEGSWPWKAPEEVTVTDRDIRKRKVYEKRAEPVAAAKPVDEW